MTNVIEVCSNLYLGNQESINDSYFINSLSCIINLSGKRCHVDINNINLLEISINDDPEEQIINYFKLTFDMIELYLVDQKKILVYCKIGKSRSVTIILNYFMIKENLSYELAFIKLLNKKSQIGPNHGFIAQLKKYRQDFLGNKYSIQKIIDKQILKEYKFNLSLKLKGKKTIEQWENQRKEREIERFLESIIEI